MKTCYYLTILIKYAYKNKYCYLEVFLAVLNDYCPLPFAKAGDIKTHLSVRHSVCLSVHLSVKKTLTWLISSEVLMIEY